MPECLPEGSAEGLGVAAQLCPPPRGREGSLCPHLASRCRSATSSPGTPAKGRARGSWKQHLEALHLDLKLQARWPQRRVLVRVPTHSGARPSSSRRGSAGGESVLPSSGSCLPGAEPAPAAPPSFPVLAETRWGRAVRTSANSFTTLHHFLCERQLVRMIKNQFLWFKPPTLVRRHDLWTRYH